ncbi:MAG: 3-methyl-2-oxobutanoate hydroxymethyltransferase [Pseudomonadales bacterium]|nr:3-methyl-2-oxobutanoate hydroxymethyltransferase [Pseudomonadales bacterium]
MKNITLRTLNKIKQNGNKFACLTAYDSSFAQVVSDAEIEVILVGDSLGMVLQGKNSTVPVTVDDMVYHTRCVAQSRSKSLLISDLPFMSYCTEELALTNASRLMQAGAEVIKLEKNGRIVETIQLLNDYGIPTCAHIGLAPQQVHKLGGYRVQGREQEQAELMKQEAIALQQAGADLLLVELIPAPLAAEICAQVDIPVIGIGAGPDTDGQILVLHDMLGITPHTPPKFVKNFMLEASSIQEAIAKYGQAVRDGQFPSSEHCF